MYVAVCTSVCGGQRHLIPLKPELQVFVRQLMWVLETEKGTLQEHCTLTHWGILLADVIFIFLFILGIMSVYVCSHMYACAHVKVSSLLLTWGSRGKHLYPLNRPASLLILSSTHSLSELVQGVKNIMESQGNHKPSAFGKSVVYVEGGSD